MNYVIKAFVYCITWVLLSFSPNAKKKNHCNNIRVIAIIDASYSNKI